MTQATIKEPRSQNLLDRPLATVLAFDWEKAIYLAFLIIAIVSRFYMVGDRVVSHDESLHTQYSWQFYNGDGFQHTPLMHGPFLFHITAASFWLFGDNDFTSRIPVALFGVLLVVMPYFLRQWLGKKGALFASFLLLISPFITYYSRYIRHDIYVIVFAMVTFIATVHYMRTRQEYLLWWFAAGVAMMFTIKEVSFMYVAIFGSFLVLRLLARMIASTWFYDRWKDTKGLFALLAVAAVVLLAGLGGSAIFGEEHGEAAGEVAVAADPLAEGTDALAAAGSSIETVVQGLQVIGLLGLGVMLFIIANRLKKELQRYPEFDLIVLYVTLVLPTMTAFIVTRLGIDAMDYNMPHCSLTLTDGTPLTGMRYALEWVTNGQCWGAFLTSSVFATGGVLIVLLVVSVAVGLWWGGRRWFVPAIVFHALFALFYTSLFTNPGGWLSGMVGSLAYWLEQQGVERGSQPDHYYIFVTTFYEFLPIWLSVLAVGWWLKLRGWGKSVGFWIQMLFVAYLAYQFTNWLFNRPIAPESTLPLSGNLLILLFVIAAIAVQYVTRFRDDAPDWLHASARWVLLAAIIALSVGAANLQVQAATYIDDEGLEQLRETIVPGVVAVFIVLGSAIVYFFMTRERSAETSEKPAWRERIDMNDLFGFIPYVVWWMVLNWVLYTWAGEKMPWLSTHMVVPTALVGGWYLGERLRGVSMQEFFGQKSLALIGTMIVLLLAVFFSLQTALTEVEFNGAKTLANLTGMNVLIGRVALILIPSILLVRYLSRDAEHAVVRRSWLFAGFILLSALTIQFTYQANYLNGDYASEYLVYAHGSPATKKQVMAQVDEISMRLNGDKSMRISFDNKSSWPYYWYLRDYKNQHFFGENPDASIADSPVILAGSDKWDTIENIVRDDYVHNTYHYIWWPMEEYRNLTWDALYGVKATETNPDRGLGSRAVRQALWDIFMHRDYEQFGTVFGGNYSEGQWPLRADLRLYIRRDVLANLWDSGLQIAGSFEAPVDPYAVGEVFPVAVQSYGDGTLNAPRNVTTANGRVYIADTNNHRIQVYEDNGQFAFEIGEFGAAPGQFNEPWGMTTDDQFLYVADTWNGRIQKFTLDGEYVASWGTFEIPAEGEAGELKFYGPRSVTLIGENELAIMDTGNHRIQITTRDGEYVSQTGSNGFDLGQFSEPVGIAAGADDRIFVAEAWNRRIQVLAPDLSALYDIPIDAWEGNSLDNKPYIAADPNGRVYVTDPEGSQILIFNAIGDYVGRFGRYGTDQSSFNLPTGITIDDAGNVYVADTNNGRVLKFAPIELVGGSVEQGQSSP